MNLLLLPGNSPSSGPWLAGVEQTLAPEFDRTVRQSYQHWELGTPEIDYDFEAAQLPRLVKGLEPYVVFAKSAGTLLTLKAISEGTIKPEGCVLAGLPLTVAAEKQLPLRDWLQQATVPTIVIQNRDDPFGSYNDVAELVMRAGREDIDSAPLPGITHDYLNLPALKSVTQFLTEQL